MPGNETCFSGAGLGDEWRTMEVFFEQIFRGMTLANVVSMIQRQRASSMTSRRENLA